MTDDCSLACEHEGNLVIQFISGAIVMGYWVAGLCFLRFWRRSRDRLFATFAVAFWLLGIQRLVLAVRPEWNDEYGSVYMLRLLGFLIILGAIVDKNRTSGGRPNESAAGGSRGR